jgi:hypothetical protein
MKATVVDLRYRMNEVLKALDRNETVSVFYHGKIKGLITPSGRVAHAGITAHLFFRMRPATTSMEKVMNDLREGRYRAL